MIVYIIPGKTKTIQDAVDYVLDENKTAKNFNEFRMEYEASPEIQEDMTFEEFFISNADGINRAIQYISNEDKIGGFISGYLCDPTICEDEFKDTKRKNLNRIGKSLNDDTGNYFYHIIQSFPEGLEISDEEVHRCGVELVERLGLYQAVVASHIHPVIDEEGEVHGRCKHNHIIMNSHIYHEFVDKDNPHKIKYHDCKDTYAQLQLINDQIAIEHGLPIIAEPDMDRVYSWFETKEKNQGKSWKERVRIDVNNAMRTSSDFNSFEESMLATGYKIRTGNSKEHGQYVTYTCPDGKNKVRDYVLGRGYTKAELEAYWNIKKSINQEQKSNNQKRAPRNKIEKILETTSEPLSIKFKKELSEERKKKRVDQNLNNRDSYTNYLPLTSSKTYSEAELSYFALSKSYEIVNSKHHTMTEVSGQDILDYYRRLRERDLREKEEEAQRRKERQYRAYYSRNGFVKSATREPYRISRYDENGRERTVAELILYLAAVIIQNEFGKWEPPYTSELNSEEYENDPIYAQKDWKIQNMLDTIRIAREENISNALEVDERCDKVGKEIKKSAAEIRRLTDSINRMEPMIEAIQGYREVKDICEKIHEMPDGPEKTELQKRHAKEIESYKEHKALIYRFKVTPDDIQDVLERYEEYINKRKSAKEQNEKFRQQYQNLSKLKYNLQLAQNKQYCYGPAYMEIAEIVEDHTLDSNIQAAEKSKKHASYADGIDR